MIREWGEVNPRAERRDPKQGCGLAAPLCGHFFGSGDRLTRAMRPRRASQFAPTARGDSQCQIAVAGTVSGSRPPPPVPMNSTITAAASSNIPARKKASE